MLKMYATLIYISTGIIVWFLGFLYVPKKIMKKRNYKDKDALQKHLKFRNFKDLIVGLFYVSLGILLYNDILTINQSPLFALPVLWIDRIIEDRLGKKYKGTN